jgi:DNA-binding response OmpR family regulator
VRSLIVDSDQSLAGAAAAALRRSGLAADTVSDIASADVAIAVNHYDCVVFERRLPDGTGWVDSAGYVYRRRRQGWTTPVLFLSAVDTVDHRVAGFDHGGDDHLTKPFAPVEFVARVRSLCRRSDSMRPAILRAGDLELDSCRHRATRGEVPLALTAKEFAVLHLLVSRPGEVLTRSTLLDRCWDEMAEPMSNVVDVLVAQLRRKVGAPSLIHTVRGAGYRLDPVGVLPSRPGPPTGLAPGYPGFHGRRLRVTTASRCGEPRGG